MDILEEIFIFRGATFVWIDLKILGYEISPCIFFFMSYDQT